MKYVLHGVEVDSWPSHIVATMSAGALPIAFFEQDTAWQGPVLLVVDLDRIGLDAPDVLTSSYSLGWHIFDWPSSFYDKGRYMFFSIEWRGVDNKLRMSELIQKTVTALCGERSISYLTGEVKLIR